MNINYVDIFFVGKKCFICLRLILIIGKEGKALKEHVELRLIIKINWK